MVLVLPLISYTIFYSPLLLLLCWGWYYWRNRKLMALARKLSTVLPTMPVLGHLHHNFQFSGGLPEFLSTFLFKILPIRAAKQGIYQFCLWIGPFPVVFIQSPEDVQTVLTNPNCRDKGPEYDLVDFAMKDGLLTAKGEIWKPTRRHIGPLFHPRNVEHLMSSFNCQGRRLCSVLAKCEEGHTIDVLPEVLPLTVHPVLKLILGEHVSAYESNPEVVLKIISYVKKSLKLWMVRVLHCYTLINPNRLFHALYRKPLDNIDRLIAEFTGPAVQIFQELPANSITKESEEQSFPLTTLINSERQMNLLDIYLSMKNSSKSQKFTEENLKFNMCTIIVGGTDTTSVILSSCLLMLAMHPDIQEKVFEEMSSISGPSEEDVAVAEIKQMTYLEQVIKETLRLFPVIPLISRTVKEDLELSFGTVPAGSSLYICFFGLHRNPNIFKNPNDFDPDRFAPELHSSRHKFSYLPFSGGPRNCIGKDYSLLSMKTSLVHVLRTFRLSTNLKMDDIKFTYTLDISIANGYPINAERREHFW